MTAKEKLLAEAPRWTDAQATAALRVVEVHTRLATYFGEEADLPAAELDARERTVGPRRTPARQSAKTLVSRGAIFWLDLEAEGHRPVCVLTRDEAIPGLRNLVVALVTARIRELVSEVRLGPEDGMPASV